MHGRDMSIMSAMPLDYPPAKILMIEDSPSDVFLFRMMLEEEEFAPDENSKHYKITDVSRLTDAFKLLRSEDFDLIILDMNLPDIHGVASVGVIRAEAPDTPLIVYSGMDSTSLKREALANGASRYLVKGVENIREVKKFIDDALCGVTDH